MSPQVEAERPEPPPAVHTEGLGKRFGLTWAVEDVDLSLRAGGVVLVVGPNGAGKSTLLGLLASLLRPTSGSVRIFGRDPTTEGGAVRRSVGVLTHQPMLYPHLTVRENLTFFAGLYGQAQEHPDGRVAQLLEEWNLTDAAETPVRSLSHGTSKRTALARTALHEPRLLLLDEPFAGLDEGSRELLRGALERLHSRGVSAVVAVHEMGPAADLADTVAVLSAGRLRGWESRSHWSAGDVQEFYRASAGPQRANEEPT